MDFSWTNICMRKIVLFIFATFSFLIHFDAEAQKAQEQRGKQRHFDREAFEARRNAFITAELGLTPEEAAQFIPLCNELRQKRFEAGRECRNQTREIRKKTQVSDAEYTQAIDVCLEAGIKEAELEKAYYERFKAILSPEKLYKLRESEAKFMRSFMKGERGHGPKE